MRECSSEHTQGRAKLARAREPSAVASSIFAPRSMPRLAQPLQENRQDQVGAAAWQQPESSVEPPGAARDSQATPRSRQK